MNHRFFLLSGLLLFISLANAMEEKRQKVEETKAEEPKSQIPSLMVLSNKAIAKQLLIDCPNDSAAIFNWLNTSDITTGFKVEIILNMLEQVSEQDINTDIVVMDVALLMLGSLADERDQEAHKKLSYGLSSYTYRSLFVACYRISTFTEISNAQELSKNALIHILKLFRDKILENEVNELIIKFGAKKVGDINLTYLVDTLDQAKQLQKAVKEAFHDKRKTLILALDKIFSCPENKYMIDFINICAQMMSCTIKSIKPAKQNTISGLTLLRRKTPINLLERAVITNKPEVFKLLLGKRAKIATKSNSLRPFLFMASHSMSKDVVKLLLEKGVYNAEEDFQYALRHYSTEILKLFVDYRIAHNNLELDGSINAYVKIFYDNRFDIDKLELLYLLVMKASLKSKLVFLNVALALGVNANNLFIRCLASIDSLSFSYWKILFDKAIETNNTAISEALLKVKLDGYDDFLSLIADKFPEQDRLN